MAGMDRDGNGQIDFPEFRAAIQLIQNKLREIEKVVKKSNSLYAAHSNLIKGVDAGSVSANMFALNSSHSIKPVGAN